jgi:hypothetical protein
MANEMHVRLAVGRNFSDCSPVKGSYKGTSSHLLHVGVSVSYENGNRHDDNASAILAPQPKQEGADDSNSYRRYIEMMQQQQ